MNTPMTADFIGPHHPCYDHGEWDHDWETIDDSYDHDFGTEIIVFDRCARCDAKRVCEPPCFSDDVF